MILFNLTVRQRTTLGTFVFTVAVSCHVSELLQIEAESPVTAQSLISVYVRGTLTYQPLSGHGGDNQPNYKQKQAHDIRK